MLEGSFSSALRFRVLGIPVEVEATFFATTLILAGGRLRSAESFVIWIGVVFVSILAHELGHALVGIRFGLTPSIRIYGWGGLTSWTGGAAVTRARDLVISLAGPAVGIALGAACYLAREALPEGASRAAVILDDFIWASGIWGAVNLVPLLPLDGGQALQAVLGMFMPARAEQVTRVVSTITGAIVGAVALRGGYPITGLMALWLGWGSARAFLRARRLAQDEALVERYEPRLWAAHQVKDAALVIALAREALAQARTDGARSWLAEHLAMGHAAAGDITAAVAALDGAPAEVPCEATIDAFVVIAAVEQRRRALAVTFDLDPARVPGTTMLASDAVGGEWEAACEALRGPLDAELEPEVFGHVREAAEVLGRDRDAGPLGERLFERDADPDLAFALACVWARAGDETRALRFAEEAVARGFRDRERAASTPALALPAGRRAAAAIDRA